MSVMFCHKIYYLILIILLFCEVSTDLISANNLKTKYQMARFCANLAFLFTEKPLLERYNLAKNAGFKAVETGFPLGLTKEEVTAAKTASGLKQVLINTYTGDISKGELGFAALPGKEDDFKKSIEITIDYAKALGVNKIHIMSGTITGESSKDNDDTYEKNLRYVIPLLEKENIMGLIEPVNSYSLPNYYMNSYDKALRVLKKINSPNLKLMFDVFHLQLIKGNIVHSIQEMKDYIGHVQIAQTPHRHEPNIDGELNYKYVLQILEKEGYHDWIGLEYKPIGNTTEGLKWITEFGYTL